MNRTLCIGMLCVLALTTAAGQETPATTVLRCGHLLDVRAGKMLANQAIVVRADKLESVGGSAPSGATVIDLAGMTCLPGLIDMHTHLIGDSTTEYDVAEPLKKSEAQMAYEAIANARATLEAGFTSVRDLGTFRAFVDVALRDAIDKGTLPGPRMQPAGAYVTISGGAGDMTGFAHDVELPRSTRFGVADGPDQVRRVVREIIRQRAGVIKVLATGAVLTLYSQPGAQEFTETELRAAVEEASKAGLRVAAHAHAPAGAKAAVLAGVASIEHGSFLDEEVLQLMKQRGTFLVPDTYDHEVIMANKSYPAEYRAKEEVAGEAQKKVLRRALELGVKIAFGTDSGVIRHGDNGKQFATYVANGMTPLFAIQTATVNAAALLGWDDRVGSLEPGKFADVIAVEGNPLEDIRAMERVRFVMKAGRVEKTAAVAR